MKPHAIALAALLLAFPGAAGAKADTGDADTITSCIKTEQDAGRDARSCAGRISEPCMKELGGDSTLGMRMCLDRETKVWDALLNQEYQALISHLEGNGLKKVKAAQRAWIAGRDADCEVPYGLFEGGTIAGPMAAQCMLDATADRVLQLKAWREMTEN